MCVCSRCCAMAQKTSRARACRAVGRQAAPPAPPRGRCRARARSAWRAGVAAGGAGRARCAATAVRRRCSRSARRRAGPAVPFLPRAGGPVPRGGGGERGLLARHVRCAAGALWRWARQDHEGGAAEWCRGAVLVARRANSWTVARTPPPRGTTARFQAGPASARVAARAAPMCNRGRLARGGAQKPQLRSSRSREGRQLGRRSGRHCAPGPCGLGAHVSRPIRTAGCPGAGAHEPFVDWTQNGTFCLCSGVGGWQVP